MMIRKVENIKLIDYVENYFYYGSAKQLMNK